MSIEMEPGGGLHSLPIIRTDYRGYEIEFWPADAMSDAAPMISLTSMSEAENVRPDFFNISDELLEAAMNAQLADELFPEDGVDNLEKLLAGLPYFK